MESRSTLAIGDSRQAGQAFGDGAFKRRLDILSGQTRQLLGKFF